MWYEPEKYKRNVIDCNPILAELKGELDTEKAKLTLAQFLRRNIGFTTELVSGVKLAPYQIITIKGMLNRNFTLCVFGRGCGKTFSAAMFCILQCLFEPNSNILIAGPTFRTSRFIFNHIEKTVESNEGKILLDAFGAKSRKNDEYKWKINGGTIVAIPLNGEKIRGFRANVLVIDEFLLMSEETVEKVLIPYLVAPQDIKYRLRIRAKEDDLIERGLMKEEERIKFANTSKMIALSSASYQCEYLYRKYQEYIKEIYNPTHNKNKSTYFVSQMAWDSIPPDLIDPSIIELAQSNQANSANFAREYGAQFVDGSDSYFSMKKMLECSIPHGEEPTLLLRGKKDKKYIVAIDPNFSNSATADHFAMCVLELDDEDPEKPTGTVVHSYAKAGKDLKDHILYLHYIMTSFNVVMIIIDHAGYQFLEAANESQCFRDSRLNIKFIEFRSEKDEPDYGEEVKNAKKQYNLTHQAIAFHQYFTTDFIRKANEWLQGCIDYKKIYFGSPIKGNESAHDLAIHTKINPILFNAEDTREKEGEGGIIGFIDSQDLLIKQTRYQCASIEVKSTAKGTQTFDLPQLQKRDTSVIRPRRDSYTALMLAAWGMKSYFDVMKSPSNTTMETFTPFFVQ